MCFPENLSNDAFDGTAEEAVPDGVDVGWDNEHEHQDEGDQHVDVALVGLDGDGGRLERAIVRIIREEEFFVSCSVCFPIISDRWGR